MILRIMRDLLRPTVWVTVERVFTEVFSLSLFAVQARLLGPTAFGLIAAVMVFISFWDAVPMNAVLEALVSVRRIEERHFTTGATATVLVSLMFGAAVFGCAGPMADLFGDAEMGSVMRAMAVLPLLQAFSIVPLAMTRREVRFQATTVRTIVSLVAGGAVGLVLALAGVGVWALVWQALVQRLVAAIVLWSIVRVPVRPVLSFRHGHDLLGFIMPVLWSSVMSWGAGQLPRLFLGDLSRTGRSRAVRHRRPLQRGRQACRHTAEGICRADRPAALHDRPRGHDTGRTPNVSADGPRWLPDLLRWRGGDADAIPRLA